MICKNCGAEIPENSKFCTFCGSKTTIEETRTEVSVPAPDTQMASIYDAAATATPEVDSKPDRFRTAVSNLFHSKLFLVLNIFLAICGGAAALSAASQIVNGRLFNVTNILVAVFAIIGCVAGFKIYAKKGQLVTVDEIKKGRNFSTLEGVFSAIEFGACIALSIIIVALCVALAWGHMNYNNTDKNKGREWTKDQIEEIYNQGHLSGNIAAEAQELVDQLFDAAIENPEAFLITVIVVAIVFPAVSITLSCLSMKAAFYPAKYYKELAVVYGGGQYKFKKTKHVLLYVMGVITALGGLSLFGIESLATIALGGWLFVSGLFIDKMNKTVLDEITSGSVIEGVR